MDLDDTPEFSTTCDLRWSDFDRLGHLNQAVYHVLAEVSRTAWMERVRPADLEPWNAFVLVRVEMDYRREVGMGEKAIEATTRLVRIGTSSITAEQEIRLLDGTVAAVARCVMVGWNAQERGKRVFGEAEREAFLR